MEKKEAHGHEEDTFGPFRGGGVGADIVKDQGCLDDPAPDGLEAASQPFPKRLADIAWCVLIVHQSRRSRVNLFRDRQFVIWILEIRRSTTSPSELPFW